MTDTTPTQQSVRSKMESLSSTKENQPSAKEQITAIFDDLTVLFNQDKYDTDISLELADKIDEIVITNDSQSIDWDFLLDIAKKCPPADITTAPNQDTLSNVIARNIIRERIWSGSPNSIPTAALRYLRVIDWDIDGEHAAENKSVYAWGWGHNKEPVERIFKSYTTSKDVTALIGGLPHLLVADQKAGTDFIVNYLLNRNYYHSEDSVKKTSPTTIKPTYEERNYQHLVEIYGSIKDIGNRNKITKRSHPSRPLNFNIFDHYGDFEYTDETLERLHNAFPDSIVEEHGKLDDPISL